MYVCVCGPATHPSMKLKRVSRVCRAGEEYFMNENHRPTATFERFSPSSFPGQHIDGGRIG